MCPIVTQALYVEGQQVGGTWIFGARCFVEDPPQSGAWRKATAGEVEVSLDDLGEWWEFTKNLETKNTDASGNVNFAGPLTTSNYAMEAKHNVSGDRYKVSIACHDDGTYDVNVEID